jgi:hypothetical protein
MLIFAVFTITLFLAVLLSLILLFNLNIAPTQDITGGMSNYSNTNNRKVYRTTSRPRNNKLTTGSDEKCQEFVNAVKSGTITFPYFNTFISPEETQQKFHNLQQHKPDFH